METLWTDLMAIEIAPLEKIVRTTAVYLGMVLLIRFLGRRIIAQMNSLDLVVVLLLSNVVQNAIIGADNSLVGGLLGAMVLILINQGLDRWSERWPALRRFLEGPPTTLVSNGEFDTVAARRMGLGLADIAPALRNQGASNVQDVRQATLVPDGALIVDLSPDAQPVSRADLAAALDQLRADLLATRGPAPG